jgi:hypothetical protein
MKTALALKNLFVQNKALVHVDLSHNGLMDNEIDLISEGLKDNHTILGLHMIGNQKNTDALGYVTDRENTPAVSHIIQRIQTNLDMGTVNSSRITMHASSNCWICEGWT